MGRGGGVLDMSARVRTHCHHRRTSAWRTSRRGASTTRCSPPRRVTCLRDTSETLPRRLRDPWCRSSSLGGTCRSTISRRLTAPRSRRAAARLPSTSRCEMWGDLGRCGEISGDVGRRRSRLDRMRTRELHKRAPSRTPFWHTLTLLTGPPRPRGAAPRHRGDSPPRAERRGAQERRAGLAAAAARRHSLRGRARV